jgi:hypothetical protein
MNLIWLGSAHIRTSTLLMVGLLIAAGALRRRPLQGVLAAMAWLVGYESIWQLTANWMLDRPIGWPVGLGLGVVVIVYVVAGVRLDWRWVGVAVTFFLAWMLIGFHYNVPETRHFDWWSESLNELSKTAWGLAYLWPLLRQAKRGSDPRRVVVGRPLDSPQGG